MNLDENDPDSQHIVEIPGPRRVLIVRRRSYPILIAGACLGLAGALLGVFLAGRQRASDEHLTTDALQREELRDGWKTLGAAAVLDAQTPNTAAAPVAPPANVLIVNVPGQAGAQGPQGAPGQPGQTVIVGAPSYAATLPSSANSNATGSTVGSAPITSYGVPVTGYVSGTPDQSPVNGVGASGAAGPAVGNGSIPGAASNPALPGTGNNGSAFPSPGAANSSLNIPNPTSNLPSGTSNLPSGTSNLPSGSSSLPSGVP